MTGAMTDGEALAKAVSDLWEKFGPVVLLKALAKRVGEESAVALGEDSGLARRWERLSEELDCMSAEQEAW